MKDVANERQSSDLLLLRGQPVLLSPICSIIPGSVLKVADVELRNEEPVLHLTELVPVVDDKLSDVLDAGRHVDAFFSLSVNLIRFLDCLAINAVCIDGYDVTCQFSEKLLHNTIVLDM